MPEGQRPAPVYKRVLLKISGEGFCHEGGFGIEASELEAIARQCVDVAKMGVQLAIVVGGGNFIRGATFAEAAWTASSIAAVLVALVSAIAMWWIYFHIGAEAGSEHISKAEDTGRIARLAYTYLHLPIVAGIVVSAVGDELLLAHPDGHSGIREILGMIGGPLLYLAGVILFKRGIRGHLQPSHLAGIGLFVILVPFAHLLTPLALSAATTAVMLIVAIWEAISLGRSNGCHSEAASS